MTDYGAATSATLAAGTSAQVLQRRPGRRLAFSIANVGANAAYVALSETQAAAVSSGIYLAPGGVLTDSYQGSIPPWQGSISAISAAGTTLAIFERVVL